MTCIVGLASAGKVYIGGDSAGVGPGWSLNVRADRKVFRNGGFIMGFTHTFRMGQLLQYTFTPPVRQVGQDLMAYMARDFAEAVRQCMKTAGHATQKDGADYCGQFLVGTEGRLFYVDSDFHIGETFHGFEAVGCGYEIARGAMAVTKGEPKQRVTAALKAAEMFSAGVRGPFHIEAL